MPLKPRAIPTRLLQASGDRSMTYISAFECRGGIVLCADTQESHEASPGHKDEKEYVEKLYVPETFSFPIAIGGAGLDEPIEIFSLELFERIEKQKPPATIAELRAMIQSSLDAVHESDAKVSAWPSMYRTTKCIVAAKPTNDDFAIFVTTGKRVSYRKRDPVIIGYDTPANRAVMKRMYRAGLPMQQAVMLAIYLLSQSKARDVGVGGDSRIVIVRDNGTWIDDAEYVAQFEKFIGQFLELIDPLFLDCVDVSIPPSSVFPEKLKEFGEKVTQLRHSALIYSAAHTLNRRFDDPNYKGEPYPKIFPGSVTSMMGDGRIEVREEPKEERERRIAMMRDVEQKLTESRAAHGEVARLLRGRTPIYESIFKTTLQPDSSANVVTDQLPPGSTSVLPNTSVADKGQQ